MDFDMDSDGDYDGDYEFDADGDLEMEFEVECDGDDDLDYEVETDDSDAEVESDEDGTEGYSVTFDYGDNDPEILSETNAPEAESDETSATYSWDQGEPHQTGIRHSRFTDDMGDGRHNKDERRRNWHNDPEYQDPGDYVEEEPEFEDNTDFDYDTWVSSQDYDEEEDDDA